MTSSSRWCSISSRWRSPDRRHLDAPFPSHRRPWRSCSCSFSPRPPGQSPSSSPSNTPAAPPATTRPRAGDCSLLRQVPVPSRDLELRRGDTEKGAGRRRVAGGRGVLRHLRRPPRAARRGLRLPSFVDPAHRRRQIRERADLDAAGRGGGLPRGPVHGLCRARGGEEGANGTSSIPSTGPVFVGQRLRPSGRALHAGLRRAVRRPHGVLRADMGFDTMTRSTPSRCPTPARST